MKLIRKRHKDTLYYLQSVFAWLCGLAQLSCQKQGLPMLQWCLGLINNAALDDTFVYAGAWSSISTAKRRAHIGTETKPIRNTLSLSTPTRVRKKKRSWKGSTGGLCMIISLLATGCGITQCSAHTKNTINPKTASSTAMSAPR